VELEQKYGSESKLPSNQLRSPLLLVSTPFWLFSKIE
jgi:hypothetical protein